MSGRVDKSRRQRDILDLLRRRRIASQGQLAEALAERGHHVTQSTLSRDLKDLRVLRVAAEDGYRYLPAGVDTPGVAAIGMRTVAAAEVLRVTANESLVVIRTQVGRASGVAAFLDSLSLENVLATVAGDDTILVVPDKIEHTETIRARLAGLFRLG